MVSDIVGRRERSLLWISGLLCLTFLCGLRQTSVALAHLAGIHTDVDVLCIEF